MSAQISYTAGTDKRRLGTDRMLVFLAGCGVGVIATLLGVYCYEFAQFLRAYGEAGGPPWERLSNEDHPIS